MPITLKLISYTTSFFILLHSSVHSMIFLDEFIHEFFPSFIHSFSLLMIAKRESCNQLINHSARITDVIQIRIHSPRLDEIVIAKIRPKFSFVKTLWTFPAFRGFFSPALKQTTRRFSRSATQTMSLTTKWARKIS